MGQVAIITGASSGIGKCLSIDLAEIGYRVILVARSTEKLQKLSDEIRAKGGGCLTIPADIAIPSEIEKIRRQANSYGDVSLVINNAGVGNFNKIEDVTLEDWNHQMDINLRGSFLVSQAFIPNMKKLNEGRLVFINSVAGKQAYPYSSVYVSSKHALRGLADSFREELREDNIKVISIYPGAINTPFWNSIGTDFPKSEMLKVENVSKTIINAIEAPENCTVEEIVVRRTKGDF